MVWHRIGDNLPTGHHFTWINMVTCINAPSGPQFTKRADRRLTARSREASRSRDLYLEWSDRSEIWLAHRQHCCRCACQISDRCDNSNYQSRDSETSRYLTIRRFVVYWNEAPIHWRLHIHVFMWCQTPTCSNSSVVHMDGTLAHDIRRTIWLLVGVSQQHS